MGTSTYDKYPQSSDFGGRKVLNLGCGFTQYSAKNVVNLDAFDICKPNVVWDLNKTPLPFEDGTFDLIIANHIFEHIQNWWDTFNECARILKTNGRLEIWVPGSGSDSIRGYRDHIHEINACGFFGTFGTYRAGGNAWAKANSECHANWLKSQDRNSRLLNRWWLNYLTLGMKQWVAQHLRNVIVEDGYFFRKVTKQEMDEEARRYEQQADGHRALALLSMQSSDVHEGH